jgi:hypothetical protein
MATFFFDTCGRGKTASLIFHACIKKMNREIKRDIQSDYTMLMLYVDQCCLRQDRNRLINRSTTKLSTEYNHVLSQKQQLTYIFYML